MPYSIPLWTILTKWPPPLSPQCRYPCSAVPPVFSRPGVRGMSPTPGAMRLEDGIEMLDGAFGAADHHAVAALESPDAAAGAYIHVMNSFGSEFFGAADVVDVVGVAAVDEDVAGFEMRVRCQRWCCPRLRPESSTRWRVVLRVCFARSCSEDEPTALSFTKSSTDLWRPVEDHAFVAGLNKPADHIRLPFLRVQPFRVAYITSCCQRKLVRSIERLHPRGS